ncbi:MAG: hypothetical protein DA330_07835 [Nitrososphaera sp.]|nr:hypothetical protein [Nitrososphaera sp.]
MSGKLAALVVVVWLMILAVAGFLVVFAGSVNDLLPSSPRIAVSAVQATIAVSAVTALAVGLGLLKRVYLGKMT